MRNSPYSHRLALLFACSQLIGVGIILILLWRMDFVVPERFASRMLPLLIALFVCALWGGFMDYRLGASHGVRGYKIKAVGTWLFAIVTLDLWLTNYSWSVRDTVGLLTSGLLLLPSIWGEIRAFRATDHHLTGS